MPYEPRACPVCGGSRLTCETAVRGAELNQPKQVTFAIKGAKGLFKETERNFNIGRARVCLSCGFVLWFLSEEQLPYLVQTIDQYESYHD